MASGSYKLCLIRHLSDSSRADQHPEACNHAGKNEGVRIFSTIINRKRELTSDIVTHIVVSTNIT